MEAGKLSENQQCEEETQEPDEQSGEEEEEEEHCLPLEETMAASWIAQIGEEGLSVTEAVGLLHCHERVVHVYLGPGPGTQEGSTTGSRIHLITYSSAKSSEWFPTAATDNASVFDFHGRRRDTERSSCSTAQGKQVFSLQEEGSLEG